VRLGTAFPTSDFGGTSLRLNDGQVRLDASALEKGRTTMRRTVKYLLMLALIFGVGAWPVTRGQTGNSPGSLDTSFGTGGVATEAAPSIMVSALATQTLEVEPGVFEDMVVAVGSSPWTIARYRATGERDTNFGPGGSNGWVTKTFKKGESALAGVVVDSHNRLVVAGKVPVTIGRNTVSALAVARYNADGTADAGFGTDGLVVIPVSPNGSWPNDVALQSDDKVVAVGRASPGYLFAVRLLTDGTPDPEFNGGQAYTYSHENGKLTIGYSVAVQAVLTGATSEERIVLAAYGRESQYPSPYLAVTMVMRLTPNGTLDQTFGANGSGMTRIAVPTAEETDFLDMTIDSDKRIVAAGTAYYHDDVTNTYTNHALIARLDENGSLDSTFGEGGTGMYVASSFDQSDARGIAIQPDGWILAAGNRAIQLAGVLRLSPNGFRDDGFGAAGWATKSSAYVRGITLVHKSDDTHTFVVGGSAITTRGKTGNTNQWALWRYFY
jgi:uncharacterized delta-60 repeat protein